MAISRERAERIARAHACVSCQEYTWRKLTVREATPALRDELGEVWHVLLVCGVCGAHQELGLDDDGDVLYAG
ncbi:MAG: hypothetical protein LCH84_18780 [Gemmatimonadetes bacterium]|nr:hypothetical protein [Gemmatimonadota bacterium]